MLRCSQRPRVPFGGGQAPTRHHVAARRSIHAQSMQIAEHSAYISEVAVTPAPKQLPALLRVFEVQGHTLVQPADRKGLHPLVIPLVRLGSSSSHHADSSAGDVLGLLRWPQPSQHKGMVLPLVLVRQGRPAVHLLARSAEEYLHRLLAEEDLGSGPGGPLAAAAGPDGTELYAAGGVAAAGMADKLNMYLIRKVGMFPDVTEALARGHLGRGDVTSALVAAEWYMRNNHFPGWGRPYEFAAELYEQVGKREEERRDMSRMALRQPWWSLQRWGQAREWSELAGSPSEVHYALSDEAAAKASAQVTQFTAPQVKSPQQEALEKASKLLDLVAAGGDEAVGVGSSYSSILTPLAEQYEAAGLKDVANFVRAAQ